MKSFLSIFAAVLTIGVLGAAHDPNRGHAEVTLKGQKISMEYGRPELKGRDMLARLQPGQEWRTGMDAATTLDTPQDLALGGVQVAKGKYILTTRKDAAGNWSLLLRHQQGADPLVVPLASSQPSSSVEKFTIQLTPSGAEAAKLVMTWGTLELSAKVELN